MKKLIMTILAICTAETELFAQSNYSGTTSASEAIRLRSTRESAVAHCGLTIAARNLVESEEFGNEAAKAILNCSRESGSRLAEFFQSGGLSKLARPKELLVLISQQSDADDIVKWIIDHQSDLTDKDAVDAFIEEPTTFVLSLRKIATAAQERKAKRLENDAERSGFGWSIGKPTASDRRTITGCAIIAGLVVLARWLWKRKMRDSPA
jgi:hypothetical protein